MKYLSVITLLVLCCLQSVFAQNPTQRLKIYKTWVLYNDGAPNTRGVLYDLEASTITLSNSFAARDYRVNNFEVKKISINDIKAIKVRRKNNVGKFVLIGTLTGAVVGGIMGYTAGEDTHRDCLFDYSPFCIDIKLTAEEKAYGAGFVGAALGAGLGALIGRLKIKIPINGNEATYDVNKSKLIKYSIVK